MGTLVQKVEAAIASKENIRQSIINKGVDVPQRTPFRQYPDKINEILNEFVPEWRISTSGEIATPVIRDQLIFPTEVDGQLASTTFTYGGYKPALYYINKLIWPEHFLTVSLSEIWNLGSEARTSLTKEIECSATNVTGGATGSLRYLKSFRLPKYAGDFSKNFLNADDPISDSLHIDVPEASGEFYTSIGTSTHSVELSINAPKVLYLGDLTTKSTLFQYCTCELEFPSVVALRYHKIPNGEQTLKLPSLDRQTYAQGFNAGGSGVLHLYIGPNLSRCDCAANWVANADYIDIHIPAGDNTTKATLDAAGVAYTQDYVI